MDDPKSLGALNRARSAGVASSSKTVEIVDVGVSRMRGGAFVVVRE